MSEAYSPDNADLRPRRGLGRLLALPFIAFAIGVAAMGYGLSQWPQAARFLGLTDEPQRLGVAPTGRHAGPDSARFDPDRLGITAGDELSTRPEVMLARIMAVEARVDRLNAQQAASGGHARRAESMLIAFAARRALDRGVQLGYLESLLRERFGASQPQAIATIIMAGRERVTLAALAAEFEKIAPQLQDNGETRDWWDALKDELSGLVIVRRGNAPSTRPNEVVARIRAEIANGNIAEALTEINRLPLQTKAANWTARARSYVMARNALDRVETAALIEPMDDAPATPPAN